MTDFHTLDDAFAEYERRADEAATHAGPTIGPPRRTRPALVAASVVAVAALAVGAVVLGRNTGSSPSHQQAGAASASPLVTHPLVTHAATTSHAPKPTPTSLHRSMTHTRVAPLKHAKAASFQDDFLAAFTRVLGDSATFTVTYEEADVLGGVLTNADGVSGGYDVQYFAGQPSDEPTCPDTDRATCTVRVVSGGGSVAYIKDPLEGAPDSYSNIVEYVRSDGVHFIMTASNQKDPKGLSPKLAAAPPFTIDQIIAVLTSDKW